MDESPNSRNRNVEFTVFFFKFEFITRGSWASGIFKFARIWDAAKNLDDFQRRSSTTFVGAKGGGGGGGERFERKRARDSRRARRFEVLILGTRGDLGTRRSKTRSLVTPRYLGCIPLHARCTRSDKESFRFTPMRALIGQRHAHVPQIAPLLTHVDYFKLRSEAKNAILRSMAEMFFPHRRTLPA